MNSTQHRLIIAYVAISQGDMLLAGFMLFKTMNGELSPAGGKCGGCYKFNGQTTFLGFNTPCSRKLNKQNYQGLDTQGGHYTC